MNQLRIAAVTVACLATLAGCAAPDASGTGRSVRAIMASQVIEPRPHAGRDDGKGDAIEASAAIAGYANYQRSYATPATQGGAPASAIGGR